MTRRLPSLVAERAVRYLAEREAPVDSVELAREVLSTRVTAEPAATRVLETAFGGDPRLVYSDGAWRSAERSRPLEAKAPGPEPSLPDRVLLLVRGSRPARGVPFELTFVSAARLSGDEVVSTCGGRPASGPSGERLRRSVAELLEGAVPVVHDPPGSLAALSRWLGSAIDEPISLRRLGQVRLGLRSDHGLDVLAARLGLTRRESDDPLEDTGVLGECLDALRKPGESLDDLTCSLRDTAPPIDWSRYDFDRSDLAEIPRAAGTYRFFDPDGALLYVGKAKDLNRRVRSYFREGAKRSQRVEALLRSLHRFELERSGSDLEAILREAASIARERPSRNVQRGHRVRGGRAERLRSILILEPAAPPHLLLAYLLRDGVLVGRVPIGRKGGGVRRVERLLEDRFFSYRPGPSGEETLEVDVELIARWLSAHRDSVVALDPTHFRSAADVVDKLRWFVQRGSLREPDGSPIHLR